LKSLAGTIILAFLATFLSLLTSDKILGYLGYPAEDKEYAYINSFQKTYKHIEFEYSFQTNSQGLRYKEIPLKKPEGTYRVLVIGDSFTEGVGVRAEDRFSSLLETSFKNIGKGIFFINAGITGSGPLEYGKLFFNVGLKYEPDGLLLCIYANDLSNTPVWATPKDFATSLPRRSPLRRITHALFPRIYVLSKRLYYTHLKAERMEPHDFVKTMSRKASEFGIPESRIDEWRRSLPDHLVKAVNERMLSGDIMAHALIVPSFWLDSLDIDSTKAEEKWRVMVLLLSEIISHCRKRGIEMGVVYIPVMYQYDSESYKGTNLWIQAGGTVHKQWLVEKTEFQRRLETWAETQGIPFLDLMPVFRTANRPHHDLYWWYDSHFTAKGHALVAKAIGEWIVKNRVFSFVNDDG
jgi:lysophospholipase L1-like esterase